MPRKKQTRTSDIRLNAVLTERQLQNLNELSAGMPTMSRSHIIRLLVSHVTPDYVRQAHDTWTKEERPCLPVPVRLKPR